MTPRRDRRRGRRLGGRAADPAGAICCCRRASSPASRWLYQGMNVVGAAGFVINGWWHGAIAVGHAQRGVDADRSDRIMADRAAKRIVDLSHVIEDGMTTYKGLPGPHICDFWTREGSAANYDDGSTFQIGRIDMVANTGTYLDVAVPPLCRRQATLPSCRWRRLPTFRASSSGSRGRMGWRSTRTLSTGRDVRGQSGAGPHRLGPALADRRLFRRSPVPDRGRGRLAGRAMARRSSASTATISTTRASARGRCTPCCSAPESRSASI